MRLSFVCKALLFDMDGTLVDSTASVESIWGEWASRHGLAVSKILAVSHGRRTVDTLREVAPHVDAEAEAEQLEAQEIASRDGVVEVAGAAALLHSVPADRWAVVTSASRPLAEARLQAAGLPLPAVLVSASDVRRGKPDPEGYLQAAAQLGVEADACLMLEDTPAGLAAGRAAGMQVWALTTTFPANHLNEANVVPNFLAVRLRVTGDELNLYVD